MSALFLLIGFAIGGLVLFWLMAMAMENERVLALTETHEACERAFVYGKVIAYAEVNGDAALLQAAEDGGFDAVEALLQERQADDDPAYSIRPSERAR